MEKRLILAMVLSFLVIVLYQVLFMKNKPQPEIPAQAPAQVQVEQPAKTEPEIKPAQEAVAPAEARELDSIEAKTEENIVVETSLYRAVWSNRGASLRSWALKRHLNELKEDLDLVSPRAAETGKYPFFLKTQDAALDEVANGSLYQASSLRLELQDGERGELKFDYSDGNTIRIEKTLVFYGGGYDIDIQVGVWKDGRPVEPHVIWGPGIGEPVMTSGRQQFGGGRGVAVMAANKVYRISERKYKPEASVFNFAVWAAYEDNYMTALFLTQGQRGSALFEEVTAAGENPEFFLEVSSPEKAYIGPKEFESLRDFGYGAQKVINFGFFGAIAEILLISIRFIHQYIPNWGFSIIILTIIIKIIFFPLTYSSTKSMAKMQELQPKIKALRAKYKKAKQDIAQRRQMNEEMMKLYKEHGINPAGGCLPMLIQIPVFWGFFRLLVVAIEFRHAPFILWISDLSVKDPYYVTPILMGATQFISQKMTPTSADPAQARMMLIMPVIMTVFFMNFQSGLVLYWLTNNVLQIGQQYIMNRMMGKKKKESHGKRKK
jgi:YidC/Oxa1 family membrane protein insertase